MKEKLLNEKESYIKIYDLYKNGLISMINNKIDFSKYNQEIIDSNLYIGTSKSLLDKNNSSKYKFNSSFFTYTGELFIEKLSLEHLNTFLSKETVDDEVIRLVNETFKSIIKIDDVDYIILGPNPTLKRKIPSGNLAFIFVFGKNTKSFGKKEEIELLKKQNVFKENLINKLSKEVKDILGVNLSVIEYFIP